MATRLVESQRELTRLQQIILEYIYSRQASYVWPVSSAMLSRELRISWTHAREQAHQLVKMGLLEVRSGPGGGYFPASPAGSGLVPLRGLAGGKADAGSPICSLVSELQAAAAELAALAHALRVRCPGGEGSQAEGRCLDAEAGRLVEVLQRLRRSARRAREASTSGGLRAPWVSGRRLGSPLAFDGGDAAADHEVSHR
ncbi:MAG: hypothetical protein AB1609_07295 [Bacillota bacterium]